MSTDAVLPVRSCDEPELAKVTFAVVAGGALPWRRRKGRLEVLVIHRPKYDDYSFPKGKLDLGESVAECAVREVREEVGLRISLGIPLPAVSYEVAKGTKVVFYWAAKVSSEAVADGGEVDSLEWLSVADARALLSNAVDRVPLDALEEAFAAGRLDTVPLVLARHAKAKPRAGWTREEGERPLATSGKRQASALAAMLMAWRPERVVSSPWLRCLQTVRPYAALRELQIRTAPALTEHAAARQPAKAAKVLEKQLGKAKATLVCTHRPVLPVLLSVLRSRSTAGAAVALPTRDPYLRPGAVIVVQRPLDRSDKIVSVEIHEPFDD
ncbi:NUDIX hydrolase [Galactobacter valiniphilus]|uniref:NUDIX hydrolase n=1 Tax=Galactobacter valiniphilus TaxID=2676122 RepID=A0A399JCT3_9MICC|nr:NUDIX hydrolase [Galactobacter valiniphilus]RII43363.1 NUDIX hydrolase [Galactobacter valiniphilus]